MQENELSAADIAEAEKTIALTAMAENFGKEYSKGTLDMWLELLDPYPPQLVREAVLSVIQSYEYKTMPPFAVLKRALDDMTGDSQAAKEQQALAEWHNLQELIPRVGSYGQPEALHPTTAFVIRSLGGWPQVCQWPTKDLHFRQKEFTEAWILAHGKTDAMALGAEGVRQMLAAPTNGPVRLTGNALKSLAAGKPQ